MNNISVIVLFASWLIDFVPVWLAPITAVIGAALSIHGYGKVKTSKDHNLHMSKLDWISNKIKFEDDSLATISTLVTLGLCSYFILNDYQGISMGLIIFAGKFLEGIASIKLFLIIDSLVRSRGTSGPGIATTLRRRLTLFALAAGSATVITVLIIYIASVGDTIYELAVLWTVIVAVATFLSYFWKVSPTKKYYPTQTHLVGMSLILVSAEIYNFGTIGTEIAVSIVAIVGQLIGEGYGILWIVRSY